MKPPRKPLPPDPEVTVSRPERPSMPRMPEPPRRRDLTPLSPMTPRPPSSAVGVPSSPTPVPGIPRAWLRDLDGYPGEEAKTPTGSLERSMLRSIVDSFHPLANQHRIDLAEIGGAFVALGETGGRERFLAMVRAVGNASEAARTELLELVLVASEMTAGDRARLIRVARALPEREVEIDVAVVE